MKISFRKIMPLVVFCFLSMVTLASAGQIVDMSAKEFERFMKKQEARKKVSVLFFFETWIPECKTQSVKVNDLFRRYVKKDVMVYGISFAGEVDDSLSNWVSDNHLRFPIIVTEEKVALKYNVVRYPYTCVVDFYGDVVKRYVGQVSYDKMADFMDKLLKELKKTEDVSA